MSKLTKKNYEAIASIIAKYKNAPLYEQDYSDYKTSEHIARDIANYFAQDNPLFQRDKFLAACGIESQK